MIKTFLHNHLDDLLAVTGAGLIILATAILSWIAALYVAGLLCLAGSVLISMGRSDA